MRGGAEAEECPVPLTDKVRPPGPEGRAPVSQPVSRASEGLGGRSRLGAACTQPQENAGGEKRIARHPPILLSALSPVPAALTTDTTS